MKGKKRHIITYRVGWMLFRRIITRLFGFKYEAVKVIEPPYIVISNHLTSFDPILIGMGFGRHMYYVATDQVLRMGFRSKLLDYFFSPIPRVKTVNETQTVITIFRRLRDKCNICIFAEGNSSFDGETCEIQPSIGKLVKKAGVTLITYRFTGSYFTLPRWGRFIRKGRMYGRTAGIYNPEKIASMSEDDIYRAIVKDISVSSYAEQEKKPVAYKGRRRAEYLETVLYLCPKCRQFGRLKSRRNMLSCECGFRVLYNEYCYFEIPGNGRQKHGTEAQPEPPFKTIIEWTKWQYNELEKIVTQNNFDASEPVFSDDDQLLFKVKKARMEIFIAKGKMRFYKDRLSLVTETGKEINFPLDKINDISGFGMMRIIFSTNENKIYEIHSRHPRSPLKYIELFKILKNKQISN